MDVHINHRLKAERKGTATDRKKIMEPSGNSSALDKPGGTGKHRVSEASTDLRVVKGKFKRADPT